MGRGFVRGSRGPQIGFRGKAPLGSLRDEVTPEDGDLLQIILQLRTLKENKTVSVNVALKTAVIYIDDRVRGEFV